MRATHSLSVAIIVLMTSHSAIGGTTIVVRGENDELVAGATVFIDAGSGKQKESAVVGATNQNGEFTCDLDERIFGYIVTASSNRRVGKVPIKKTSGTWNGRYSLQLRGDRADIPDQSSYVVAQTAVMPRYVLRYVGTIYLCECNRLVPHPHYQWEMELPETCPCACSSSTIAPVATNEQTPLNMSGVSGTTNAR
jgi:hypothetical protein